MLFGMEKQNLGPGKKKSAEYFCGQMEDKYHTKSSARIVQ